MELARRPGVGSPKLQPLRNAPDKNLNILIVEDEFFLAGHIEWLLTEAGYAVVGPVGNLAEALRVARDEKIDAALLDLNIDGGRTDDVAHILRDRNIPIAFVTGLGRASVPDGFADAAIVEKPFRDEALLDVVRRTAKAG